MTGGSPSAFGHLLRRYRVDAGLTQEELAERALLSARGISDLERGINRHPRYDTVRHLATALELGDAEGEAFEASARGAGPTSDAREAMGGLPVAALGPVSHPTNLPVEPTPFIGRKHEITALLELLLRPEVRLVTLTGPGGSGKTRLALELAAARLDAFADGVFFVSQAPLVDSNLVAPTIATTLGIKDSGERTPLETLQQALQDKHLLLVLDNFEHLLEAAPLVGDLMRSCPSLQILVTSRAILRLAAEHEFPVPPLSLPELNLRQDLQALAQSDAVALFVDRAQMARPDFVLTKANGPYIAALCHRLDGLPLALVLAAARIRLFPPQALLGRLAHRLDLLTGGARDRPTRQQTLRGAIDWSYSLLSPEEQSLFARLAVFAGGWTLEAAEAVCATEGEQSLAVLDGVASLVEQSLVRQEGENESRFGMLETIREYAAEKLVQLEGEYQIREAHAQYFLGTARQAISELRGSEQGTWLARLEREQDNFRTALVWLRDYGDPVIGLELTTALGGFWVGRGHVVEGLDWLRTFLSASSEHSEVRGRALNDASFLSVLRGDSREAHRFADESVLMARDKGDALQLGRALVSLSRVSLDAGDIERILEVTREGITIGRRVGDDDLLALHLLSRAEGMQFVHEYAEARNLYAESLELYRGLGMAEMVATNLHNLIEVELHEENIDRAVELFREKVDIAYRLRHAWIDAYTMLDFARLAAARQQLQVAARSLAAATSMFLATGVLIDPTERAGYDSTLSLLREQLEDDELASLWEEGRALTADEAMAYALEESGRILDQ